MSPEQRFQCSEGLRQTAIELHSAFIKNKYPKITEAELKRCVHEFLQRGTG
jgi:hypothetical protein